MIWFRHRFQAVRRTASWLATIGDDLAAKLTQAGFGEYIPKRESSTLGVFLKTYIGGREAEVEPGTIANFRQLERKLVEFFGADRDLRTITEGDADDWRQHLAKTYAEGSASAVFANVFDKDTVTPTGSELSPDSQGKTAILEKWGATGGAVGDELEQIAADLRGRLSVDECRRLAKFLSCEDRE